MAQSCAPGLNDAQPMKETRFGSLWNGHFMLFSRDESSLSHLQRGFAISFQQHDLKETGLITESLDSMLEVQQHELYIAEILVLGLSFTLKVI